ncbi:MAG: hypothetical protein LBF90_01140 [Prevotellaceae bacterium]|nr:hypothetical protein [Prevotellaceae bacterium]
MYDDGDCASGVQRQIPAPVADYRRREFFMPLHGQSGRVVEIRHIEADYAATPPTVKFEVYWESAPDRNRHRDTVWVFADFQPINTGDAPGAWAPATITAATVSDGTTVWPVAAPYRGFYLNGYNGGRRRSVRR